MTVRNLALVLVVLIALFIILQFALPTEVDLATRGLTLLVALAMALGGWYFYRKTSLTVESRSDEPDDEQV